MEPEWIGFVTAIIAAIIAAVSQIMLSKFRNQAEQEIEHLRIQFRKFEEVEKLKRRYSTPLLKSAEELYNKLNDVVRNRERVHHYFKKLPDDVINVRSMGDIMSSPTLIYLANILYLFARYFASVEAIKKDVGLLQLASDKETKALQLHIRQTVAVFFSGRLHNNFSVRQDDRLKYEGRILEGVQVLIGESMLRAAGDSHESISFYDFCHKIATDEDFRQCLSPLVNFLSELEEGSEIDYSNSSDIDFRWTKLILFASYLRSLIKQLDNKNVITLLPELEQYEQKYLTKHTDLERNIQYFEEAYPNP
jgi:hypothetical protein